MAAATDVAGPLTAEAAAATGLLEGTPVVVGAGDVPASQVGAGATGHGDAHVSLGTAVYFGITLDRPASDPGRQLGVLGHIDEVEDDHAASVRRTGACRLGLAPCL